ncbi:MAG: polysaccharide biosynthesis/export family protein [Phycisphaeraceae bacterium]
MSCNPPVRKPFVRAGILLACVTALAACEADTFFDPSRPGRFERTPVTLPILDQLDIIDEPSRMRQEITSVRPEDHVPDRREYVIGPGDVVTVVVFELLQPDVDAVNTRVVDAMGMIRLPVIGAVQAAGMTPTQMEQHLRNVLEREGVLRDATVSIIMEQARQNTFSILGEPRSGGTNVGIYSIPEPDFRLLDALAMARGIPGRTKNLQIYRQVALSDDADLPEGVDVDLDDLPRDALPDDPEQLLEELFNDVGEPREPEPGTGGEANGAPVPDAAMDAGLEEARGTQWVNVDGRWVRIEPERPSEPGRDVAAQMDELVTQRIIEIPYQDLLHGDMRYNIVIRPGDVIRVPAPNAGFVYIMGEINRPGAYTVPGENELTLKQLIASGGNLGALAIPERVDLVRRVADDRETIVRMDLRAIFEGRKPDIFLKPNDLINVGTSFWATPLAVVRNGLRANYGFGFVLDRNFANQVFGAP